MNTDDKEEKVAALLKQYYSIIKVYVDYDFDSPGYIDARNNLNVQLSYLNCDVVEELIPYLAPRYCFDRREHLNKVLHWTVRELVHPFRKWTFGANPNSDALHEPNYSIQTQ